jgi:hypothetical protein
VERIKNNFAIALKKKEERNLLVLLRMKMCKAFRQISLPCLLDAQIYIGEKIFRPYGL